MTHEHILYQVSHGVAEVTLNRPEKLNALNWDMLGELSAAFANADDDAAVRAVFLTGAGRAFCAGQDLSDRAVMVAEGETPDLGESLGEHYNPLVRAMRALPLPILVAVNGVAAGAGANLALAGDLVFAGKSAKFIEAFAKIGLVPDSGGTYFLPRLAGTMRAMALSMFASTISAQEAKDIGLILDAVDDEDLSRIASESARELAAGPTKALAAIKRAIYASAGNSFDEQLDLERDLQRELGRSRDYAEGVTAFIEKRPAKFVGE